MARASNSKFKIQVSGRFKNLEYKTSNRYGVLANSYELRKVKMWASDRGRYETLVLYIDGKETLSDCELATILVDDKQIYPKLEVK